MSFPWQIRSGRQSVGWNLGRGQCAGKPQGVSPMYEKLRRMFVTRGSVEVASPRGAKSGNPSARLTVAILQLTVGRVVQVIERYLEQCFSAPLTSLRTKNESIQIHIQVNKKVSVSVVCATIHVDTVGHRRRRITSVSIESGLAWRTSSLCCWGLLPLTCGRLVPYSGVFPVCHSTCVCRFPTLL